MMDGDDYKSVAYDQLTVEQARLVLKEDLNNCVFTVDEQEKTLYLLSEPTLDELMAGIVVMRHAGFLTAKEYVKSIPDCVPETQQGQYDTEVVEPFGISEHQAWSILYEYYDRQDRIMDLVFSSGKGGRTWVDEITEPQLIDALALLCWAAAHKVMPYWMVKND